MDVTNIYIAALLVVMGHDVVELKKDWRGFVIFCFKENKGINAVLDGYRDRKYKVFPKDLIKATQRLKRMIRDARSSTSENKAKDAL